MAEDGRWIAEIPEMLGVMCYGASRNDAAAKVEVLALRAIADPPDEGEMPASPITIEPMAVFEGTACVGRTHSDWLARQTTERFTPNPQPPRLSRCRARVSR